MANNRQTRKSGRKISFQEVYSEPQYILKERYLTPHMLSISAEEGLSHKQALTKYGKNRYAINPNAVVMKTIKHILYR